MVVKFLSKLIKRNKNEFQNLSYFEIKLGSMISNVVKKKEVLENGKINSYEVEEEANEYVNLEKILETLSQPNYDINERIFFTEKFFSMSKFREILNCLFFEFQNWNHELENYLFSDIQNLVFLADGLLFLGQGINQKYENEHIKKIFLKLYEEKLDKPEYLDIIDYEEFGVFKYGNIKNFQDYKKLRDFISIALDYAENYDILPNVKELEKKLTEFETLFSVGDVLGNSPEETFHTFCKKDKDKVNLFKSLVLLENKTGHLGRYAYSIRLFKLIKNLDLDSPELLDWTFKNRHPKNHYIPFGEFEPTPNIKNYNQYKEIYLKN